MAFTPKALADGQVPTTLTVLFVGTADIATYVKEFTLFNTNAIAQSIEIFVNKTGVNRKYRRFELLLNESADVLDEGKAIILEAGDTILAVTGTASAVDFTIAGVEETS